MLGLKDVAGWEMPVVAWPNAEPYGTYSMSQLVFAAASSAVLWAIFVFVQTVRHRDYFIPSARADDPDAHAEPP